MQPLSARFGHAVIFWILTIPAWGGFPADYTGQPFQDAIHKTGPANIPGLVSCALYDLGGEGVAYHDTDALNNGSGMVVVIDAAHAGACAQTLRQGGEQVFEIGRIDTRGAGATVTVD